MVPGYGILLNDEMDDFSKKPGVANVFGLVGSKANEIQPRKTMLSSKSTLSDKDLWPNLLVTRVNSFVSRVSVTRMLGLCQNK